MQKFRKISRILILFTLIFLSSCERNSLKHFLPGSNNSNSEVTLRDGEVEAYCFANIQGVVYDLSPLYDPNSDYSFKTGESSVLFNFCKFGVTKCKKDNTFVISAKTSSLTNNTSTDCTILSGTNYDNFPKWKVKNELSQPSKISIEFPEGDICVMGNTSYYYTTTFEITCDRNIAKIAVDNLASMQLNYCQNTIKMRSQHACPNMNKYSLDSTIKRNSIMFGLMLMALGIYYCFFSYKFLKVTRVLTGVTAVLFISLFLIVNNFEMKFTSSNLWSVFIICTLIGLFLGWVISKVPWVVSAVLGAFLGFIFTELLYQAIVSSLSWNPKAVYYIIFSVAVATGGLLGAMFQKHIFIIACAFTGSYAIMRGLGTLEANFPDEKQIYDLIERNEWWQVNKMIDYRFYLYLCLALILGLVGTCHQYKSYFKDIREDEYDKLD